MMQQMMRVEVRDREGSEKGAPRRGTVRHRFNIHVDTTWNHTVRESQ